MDLRPGHPSVARAFTFLITICLFELGALAQQPKVLAPHRPIAPKAPKPVPLDPATLGSVVGGPWITDANFKSSIYLKNVVENSPVTVTPILYLKQWSKIRPPRRNA